MNLTKKQREFLQAAIASGDPQPIGRPLLFRVVYGCSGWSTYKKTISDNEFWPLMLDGLVAECGLRYCVTDAGINVVNRSVFDQSDKSLS